MFGALKRLSSWQTVSPRNRKNAGLIKRRIQTEALPNAASPCGIEHFLAEFSGVMSLFKHVGYFLLPLPLAVAAAEDKAIRIGYAECARFTPQKAAKLKWYFAHASVGANMVDGLNDLNRNDSGSYSYVTFFCEKAAPGE